MKKFNNIVRMMLVLVVTLMTFSGAAITAQAAGPRDYPQRWEQRDSHWDNRDRDNRRDDRDWQKDQRNWEKHHKSQAQKDVDKANRKANIAMGVAAVATIIALTK